MGLEKTMHFMKVPLMTTTTTMDKTD